MPKIFTMYHSGYGHTKLQAEAVHKGVGSVKGVEARLVTAKDAAADLDQFDSADALIFGCPTYMGNISAEMKQFMEVAAKKWFSLAWKDKIAGAFTNSSSFSGDKLNTIVGLMINAMQHGMIYVGTAEMPAFSHPDSMKTIDGPGPDVQNRVGSFSGAMSSSFQVKPGDAPPTGDIKFAEGYGRRIAEITTVFVKGKQSMSDAGAA